MQNFTFAMQNYANKNKTKLKKKEINIKSNRLSVGL